MNFLKKKLKPLTSGLITTTTNQNQLGTKTGGQISRGQTSSNNNKDLEEDLYDEYVIEAPPHPSELLALGVDPNEIDVNDPDKLRELYRKAVEEGKDKKTNSVLLARQRQKEELEEKKRTREEWKFFDSLTLRVEEVVKTSQKNLDHWKESSTVNQLSEPEYELRQTADEVFKSVTAIKQEKGENDWIDFDEENSKNRAREKKELEEKSCSREQDNNNNSNETNLDEFGCPLRRLSRASDKNAKGDELNNNNNSFVVDELLEDFGIDLRTEEQKRAIELQKKKKQQQQQQQQQEEESRKLAKEADEQKASSSLQNDAKKVDLKAAARPRPRPRPQVAAYEESKLSEQSQKQQQQQQPLEEVDPFDTSFVAPSVVSEDLNKQEAAAAPCSSDLWLDDESVKEAANEVSKNSTAIGQTPTTTTAANYVDPFDTSYVSL